jgi:hypothetical protein
MMKRRVPHTIYVLIILVGNLTAQPITFKTTYPNPNEREGRSVVQLKRGGFLLCGTDGGFTSGSSDLMLIKTRPNGLQEWSKNFGGNDTESGVSVFEDSVLHHFIASGVTNTQENAYQAFVVCTDTMGNMLWQKSYGGSAWDGLKGSMYLDSLHYLFWGFASDSLGTRPWLFQTDTAGNIIWQKTYPTTLFEEINSVDISGDSVLYACGYKKISDTISNIVLAKLRLTGDTVWVKTFHTAYDEKANDIEITDNGKIWVLGYTKNAPQANENLYLITCAQNGDSLFTVNKGSYDKEFGMTLAESLEGYIALSGQTEGPGYVQIYTYMVNPFGFYHAATTYLAPQSNASTSNYHARVYDIKGTRDSGYVMACSLFNQFLQKNEPYLIKTDRMGNALTHTKLIPPSKNGHAFYPNPGNDKICFMETQQAIKTIRIFDTTGAERFRESNPGNCINIQFLNPGFFMTEITMNDGTIEVHRLVVTK